MMRLFRRKNPWEETDFLKMEGAVKQYYGNLRAHLSRPEFKRNVFVETGTYMGNGIQAALDVGFRQCISVEIHEHQFLAAKERFADKENVELHFGSSIEVLPKIVEELREPALFWLDAHKSGVYGEAEGPDCPVLEELAAVAASPIAGHAFLIDDVDCFKDGTHDGITVDDVIQTIQKINSDYKREYLDAAKPNNIIAFYI